MDYAHNPAGLRALYDTIAYLKDGRVITVGSAAGDRKDETIQEMGRIFGKHSDIFIIKEDLNLRGRTPGETIHLLSRGVDESKGHPSIHVQPEEIHALFMAWEMSQAGDTLLFLYDDYASIQTFMDSVMKSSVSRSEFQRAE